MTGPDERTGHFVPTGRPYVVLIYSSVPDLPPNYFGPFGDFPAAEWFARGMFDRLGRGYEITVVWDPRDGEALR
jgi:hypothetical protein